MTNQAKNQQQHLSSQFNSEYSSNKITNENEKTKIDQSLSTKLLFCANLSLINMKATTTTSSLTTLKKPVSARINV